MRSASAGDRRQPLPSTRSPRVFRSGLVNTFPQPGSEKPHLTTRQPLPIEELARELEVLVDANDQQLLKVALALDDHLVAGFLRGDDLHGALAVAEGIEQPVRALQIDHADSAVGHVVTLNIGVALGMPEPDTNPTLALADAQLYRAKHSGRGLACGAALGAKS